MTRLYGKRWFFALVPKTVILQSTMTAQIVWTASSCRISWQHNHLGVLESKTPKVAPKQKGKKNVHLKSSSLPTPKKSFPQNCPPPKKSSEKTAGTALATWIIDWPRSFCTSMACHTDEKFPQDAGLMKSKPPSSNPYFSVLCSCTSFWGFCLRCFCGGSF